MWLDACTNLRKIPTKNSGCGEANAAIRLLLLYGSPVAVGSLPLRFV
jgi:hypothetical protein